MAKSRDYMKRNSGISGFTVTLPNGQKTTFFFYQDDEGNNFFANHLGDDPEPIPQNMTPRQLKDRAEKAGNAVEVISAAERKKLEAQRDIDRKKMDDFLNAEDRQSKIAKKGSRADSIFKRSFRRRH